MTPPACELKPVYRPVVPHIDEGPDVCHPGDPDCQVHAQLPGYDLPPEVKDANAANGSQPSPGAMDAPMIHHSGGSGGGLWVCILAFVVVLFLL